MVTSLVDTTILVDLLRDHTPAIQWIKRQRENSFAITPLVWMELVFGAQNRGAQLQAARLLSRFQMIYLSQQDMAWAMEQLLVYRLSHNVGINDCLIASVNYRMQLPLYTQNMKHFVPLIGNLAQKPY